MANRLWENLCRAEFLRKGWHLVRRDIRNDFAEDLLAVESFSAVLDENIKELSLRLMNETYEPSPLRPINIPKGSLGSRPGSLLPIADRIVLHTAILLIAPRIDATLSQRVYSYRVKEQVKKGELFKESAVEKLPFLKGRDIRAFIDPFEPWYGLWPEFDLISKRAFDNKTLKFLCISDISAYFENISIPLLKDQMSRILHDEPKIVNLIARALERWAVRTFDGDTYHRGIPQGNEVSSFLGNLFLKPIDDVFEKFCHDKGAEYFRYMDDIRIFTPNIDAATEAIFILDEKVRKLYLNLQSSKTKIIGEDRKEVTRFLYDKRVERAQLLLDSLRNKKSVNRDKVLKKLDEFAGQQPDGPGNEQRIKNARHPLSGFSLRLFRMLLTGHSCMNSAALTRRLVREIKRNPDPRLTKKVAANVAQFPRHPGAVNDIIELLLSGTFIHNHQKAELIRALRYASRLPDEIIKLAKSIIKDESENYYVRMQASYLVSRVKVSPNELNSLNDLYREEKDEFVRCAISTILLQQTGQRQKKLISGMLHSPNEKLRAIGRYYDLIQNNYAYSKSQFNFIFDERFPHRVCDYIYLIYCALNSENSNIIKTLSDKLEKPSRSHELLSVREILFQSHQIALSKLSSGK